MENKLLNDVSYLSKFTKSQEIQTNLESPLRERPRYFDCAGYNLIIFVYNFCVMLFKQTLCQYLSNSLKLSSKIDHVSDVANETYVMRQKYEFPAFVSNCHSQSVTNQVTLESYRYCWISMNNSFQYCTITSCIPL